MGTTTRTMPTLLAMCLLTLTACGGSDDTAATTPPATTSPTPPTTLAGAEASEGQGAPSTQPQSTDPTETTGTPATTDPPADEPEPPLPDCVPPPTSDRPPTEPSPDEAQVLDWEYDSVPPGHYRVETIGAAFTISFDEEWWVQPNSDAQVVLTAPDSYDEGDRDLVMIRPSHLADPDRPGAPIEEQTGAWPIDDIEGWVEALIPGVVSCKPVQTTFGGLDAVMFDVAITDDVECGDNYCVGFATNRAVNGTGFFRRIGQRVWWIDGGDHSPIAVIVGDGGDATFTEHAQEVIDTIVFESIDPNPIPAQGNPWEFGFTMEVPAGLVKLPTGPGITFEMSDSHRIVQETGKARVRTPPWGEVDVFFPIRAVDNGSTITTVDDALDALERIDVETTVVGTRVVSGFEATEVDIVDPDWEVVRAPVFEMTETSEVGWFTPPLGTMWMMETPDGLAIIVAEAYEDWITEEVRAVAEEILDTIVIGG